MITRLLVRALLLVALAAAGGCDFKVNATGSAVTGQAPGYLRTAVPALAVALGDRKLGSALSSRRPSSWRLASHKG
jgi:hypothetical protein